MQTLVLDEFYSYRSLEFRDFCRHLKATIITDNSCDFKVLLKNNNIELLAFSSSFFDWELPNNFLDLLPNLKGLCISGGWHEHIDLNYCNNRNIVVTYIPDFSSTSAAEWCIFATLSLARYMPIQLAKNDNTKPLIGVELYRKRAGIIGLGGVGKKLIAKLSSMGMECSYWSNKSRTSKYKYLEVEELLSLSDFIYLCIYDGGRMAGFMADEYLQCINRYAMLISGLGSQPNLESDVINWAEVIEMVKDDKLGGVAIECGEKEKIKAYPGKNILITPGNSGWLTKESFQRQTKIWKDCIQSVIDEAPVSVLTQYYLSEGH